ncbi:hypothetical protein ABWH91_11000 [Phycisphaerales bacterium ac7]
MLDVCHAPRSGFGCADTSGGGDVEERVGLLRQVAQSEAACAGQDPVADATGLAGDGTRIAKQTDR